MLEISVIPCLKDNYSYYVFEPKSNTSILIDTPEFKAIDNFLESKNISLDFILNTHHHWDHVSGNTELKNKYNCKIFGSVLDADRIPDIDFGIDPNTPLELGDLFIKTFFAPGHTSHHVVFYLENASALFSGDTLFSMGCGRVFEGTHEELFKSLNVLTSLPEETKIYCGHEYSIRNSKFALSIEPNNLDLQKRIEEITLLRAKNLPTVPTTLELEKKINPFLRCHLDSVKEYLGDKNLSNLDTFKALRDLRDTF